MALSLPKIVIVTININITHHWSQSPSLTSLPQEETMILSENGLWVVALLFITVFLSASTIRNTRNLIIKISFPDLSLSEQYYGFNSATELQSFQMDSKPHWRRLVFTILRRKQNSLMDQSLAFCLFLSGFRQFLFSGSYRDHIFNAILKYLRFPYPSWLMLGSLPFHQVKSWINSRCQKQSNMIKDSPSDPEVRHLPCGILICARSPKVVIKFKFKDFEFNREKAPFPKVHTFRKKAVLYI